MTIPRELCKPASDLQPGDLIGLMGGVAEVQTPPVPEQDDTVVFIATILKDDGTIIGETRQEERADGQCVVFPSIEEYRAFWTLTLGMGPHPTS